ncbi:cbb3-type cytochrome c oxidase subunit I [Halococcoides cellulosivorans]|nr:cbb3-type cytochrome c oxidase subunit I [Halococcoides cellulosivorans]
MAVPPQLVVSLVMGALLVAVFAWLARVEGWATPISGGETATTRRYGAEKPVGLLRWLTTVDHKDIGKLYGVFGVVAFAWGGGTVLLMRLELLGPGADFMTREYYNGLMTTHGITMLFLFAAPFIAAFGNYVIPLLVDADDMAFPRVNAIAFWILPPATLLMWSGFFLKPLGLSIAPASMGWTMYTPLVTQQANAGIDLFLLGFHLSGIATTMSAMNFIATIVAARDSTTVPWSKLDIFSWTILTQSFLIVIVFPLLGAVIVMILLDRNFGTLFFDPAGGGAILYQHLFWFFGHPEVYILVLPPMGLVSLILPKFAGRKLFGFKFIVYSTIAIGVLSFGVWAHHMFTTGLDPRLRTSFMAVSIAIAVPSAVKVFNWIATLWNGKIRLNAPMLFMLGALQNFIIGGVTGVFLAAIPFNLVMHDTYYVVGHFHFIVYGMIGFALMGATYYFFPMMTGKMYNRRLAQGHFWLALVGSNVTFFAMMFLGYGGMPRRYATYLPKFATWHQVATLGAILITISTALWVWNMIQSLRAERTVTDGDPWQLAAVGQYTRDWAWFESTRGPAVTDGGTDESVHQDDREPRRGDE